MNNEPVAWMREDGVIAFHKQKKVDSQGYKWFPLYTHPASLVDWSYQQGYQVGKETHPAKTLTDEEITLLVDKIVNPDGCDIFTLIRAVEEAHGIRKAQEK